MNSSSLVPRLASVRSEWCVLHLVRVPVECRERIRTLSVYSMLCACENRSLPFALTDLISAILKYNALGIGKTDDEIEMGAKVGESGITRARDRERQVLKCPHEIQDRNMCQIQNCDASI